MSNLGGNEIYSVNFFFSFWHYKKKNLTDCRSTFYIAVANEKECVTLTLQNVIVIYLIQTIATLLDSYLDCMF